MPGIGDTHRRGSFRPRFGLRTILIVVAIVSATSAWLGKHIARTTIERPVVAKIEGVSGHVYRDYQIDPEWNHIDLAREPPGPRLVRSMLGDDFFATVAVAVLHGPPATDADVAPLHRLGNLLDVSLGGPGITDAAIPHLLKVKRLRMVALYDTAVGPMGIRELSQSQTLESLTLSGGNITDQHLAHLPSFPKLRHLQLGGTAVTDAGFALLAGRKDLITLDIFVAQGLTDQGLASLGELQELQQFKALETSLTDRSMETISQWQRLRFLQLRIPMTAESIQPLARLTRLEWLDLVGTGLTDEGIKVLMGAKGLKQLDVSHNPLADEGVEMLVQLPNLETLDLSETKITDAGLLKLAKLRSLKLLTITLGNQVTQAGVDALRAKHPNCEVHCW